MTVTLPPGSPATTGPAPEAGSSAKTATRPSASGWPPAPSGAAGTATTSARGRGEVLNTHGADGPVPGSPATTAAAVAVIASSSSFRRA